MPGTIQLSVLELMDLPQPEPTISSLSLKVTVGKREYQSMGKEDFSFPVMSLLGNLTVMLYDAAGNEMLRTELRTISVAEKGLWIDTFPLKGGGLILMKLQFSLSQEEHIRIREMRETVLKRKRREQVKPGVKSPLSEQGNNKGIIYSVTKGSLRAQLEQEGTDQSESSGTPSPQVSEAHPELFLGKDVSQMIEINKETLKAESRPDVIAQVPISSEESLGPQSGTSLSSVSERASQNNSSISAAMEEDQNLSSVRKMVNAFESSQFQEHPSRGLRMNYSVDKVDREGSLKRVSSEESDIISKSEPPQTIAKSFSSGMLSDMHQQRSPMLLQSAFLRKEEAEHLIPDRQHEAKGRGKATLPFKKGQKLKDMSLGEDRADKEPTGSKKPANSLKLTGLVSEREGRRQEPYPMSSKRNFGTAKEKLNNTLYEHIAVGKSGAMPEPSSQNEEDLEAERKLAPTKICPKGDGKYGGNVTSKQNTSDHLQLSHEVKLDGMFTEKNKNEICSSSKHTHSCSQATYQQGSGLETVTGEVERSRSLSGDKIIHETPSEAAELLTYADIEGYPSGNLGIWGPRHLCITTGSRQLRDLVECCHSSRRSSPMEDINLSTRTNDDKKQDENGRVTSCTSGKSEHEKSTSVSKPKSYAGLIEQGVRIAVVIVAGTLLLNTRQRKPGKTVTESKRR